MQSIIKGRIWKFGDNIDTDIILPSQYLTLPEDEMFKHAFEPLQRNFCDLVFPGDIILAGENFGCGSSREQAPHAILNLGIKVVIAKSFARIFYRNALNVGLCAIESKEAYDLISEGDIVEVFLDDGKIKKESSDNELLFLPFPAHIQKIINAGGLVNYMRQINLYKRVM